MVALCFICIVVSVYLTICTELCTFSTDRHRLSSVHDHVASQ